MVNRYNRYACKSNNGAFVLYDDYRVLEKQLAELQEKMRWRDVGQELPDAYHPIIAFISSEETMQPAMMHLGENGAPIWRFLLPIYNDCSSQVTHWIPLPDAPNKRIE